MHGLVSRWFPQFVAAVCLTLLAFVSNRSARHERTPGPSFVERASCVADFAPCGGGVLSPVKAECCNPLSTCYRRGRYFSQCRPQSSAPITLAHQTVADLKESHGGRRAAAVLCAPDYGVCAAGIGSDSSIPCCNKQKMACTLSTPFFHQCLPHKDAVKHNHRPAESSIYRSTHAWFVLRRPAKFTYLKRTEAFVGGSPLEFVSEAEKMRRLLPVLRERFARNAGPALREAVVLRAVIPSQTWAERSSFLREVRSAMPTCASLRIEHGALNAWMSEVCSKEDVWDSAMVLGAAACVREVHLVENVSTRIVKQGRPARKI